MAEGLNAALLAAFFSNFIQRDFGLFDLLLWRDSVARVHRTFSHCPANRNKFTQQRQIIDLRGKITRTDQRGPASGQFCQITDAAKRLHRLIGLKLRAQRNRIGHHIAIKQQQDRIVDPPVDRLKKMIGAQLKLHILGNPVINHQRTEQRCLRLNIVRKLGYAFGRWYGK